MSKARVAERSAAYVLQTAVEPAFGTSFDLLATAPQGVAKLRELIRILAVRGQLEPQVLTDEPAIELLRRIQKSGLRVDGGKRSSNAEGSTPAYDGPFALPPNWAWVRVGEVFSIEYGSSLPAKDRLSGNVPVYGSNGVVGFHSSALVFEPSLVIGRKGSVGAVNVALEPFWPIDTSYFVTPPKEIHLNYAELVFRWLDLGQHDKATAIPGINRNDAYRQTIGLPPLAEQARIVARVEELMQLCDALEAHGRLQDEQHARLVATLFDALAASASAKALAENWQRIATHFDLLLDRPEAVNALEQTLLQLAIRGLLVPQDPTDEPASHLLNCIATEKMRLVALGEIKHERLPPAANRDSPAFKLPIKWEWAKLGKIATLVTDGAHHTPQYLSDGVPFLSVKNLSAGFLDFSVTRFISELAHAELIKRCNPELGDLLLTKIGTTGIAVVIDDPRPFSIFVSVALIKLPSELMDRDYLSLAINSPFVRKQSEDGTEGVGNKNLVLRKIKAFDIPVPPLAEQHRIVARVEQLRRLCADLRERLQQARATQSRLADALVSAAAQSPTC